MTAHPRLIPPQGASFFTVCLADRDAATLVDHIDALRAAYAFTLRDMPVTVHAMVILPNHLHAMWSEPGLPRAADRWRRIKARFAQALKLAPGEVWQPGFYEHAIPDEAAYLKALDYCRMNPVRHGLVAEAEDWPYSSFARRPEPVARARQVA